MPRYGAGRDRHGILRFIKVGSREKEDGNVNICYVLSRIRRRHSTPGTTHTLC